MKIELRGVRKEYKSVRALDNVSLEIAPGQIVAFLGANGAGKTSLLRCLSTIAGLDKGQIHCDDELLRRDRLDLRKKMMFLPDFPFLFWHESILRNIAVALRLYGAEDQPGIEERVIETLRNLDLLPLARTPVQFLSRGQAYKAGLASLLIVNPEVWLLDEPFASGVNPGAGTFFPDAFGFPSQFRRGFDGLSNTGAQSFFQRGGIELHCFSSRNWRNNSSSTFCLSAARLRRLSRVSKARTSPR